MVTPIITRLLLFSLLPAGIFLLIRGIKKIRQSVGGAVLLNIPLLQTEAQLTIPTGGSYAIWQKGKTLGRVAINMPVPEIRHEKTGEKLQLHWPAAVVRTNDGSNGKIRVYTFNATAGQYRYQLAADSTVRDEWIGKMRATNQTSLPKYFIEVKENRPAGWLVLGILMVVLSAFCIIAGLVFSIAPLAGY